MKLLITTGLFYPSKLGGPANTLYWLAKALVNFGMDVSVAATNGHIADGVLKVNSWNDVDGIKVNYCTGRGKLPVRLVRTAVRELKSSDVLMLSSICYLPNSLVAMFARMHHKPIIWSPRGELLESALQGDKVKISFFKLLKLLLGEAVTFHATSEEEKKSIQHIFGNDVPVFILPNYMEVPTRQERLDFQPPYFVYVGRIAPIKALDNLLFGLSQSPGFMQSNYVLKIVGLVEDKFKDFYETLQEMRSNFGLQNKVEFVGPKSGAEKYQLYADARFSMLVSKSENFGNVVIEALSQGTPVIASHGTPWQILGDKNAGFWIENSPQSIAECIDKALSMDEKSYHFMRENALMLVEEYDVSKNVHKWADVLECLCQR